MQLTKSPFKGTKSPYGISPGKAGVSNIGSAVMTKGVGADLLYEAANSNNKDQRTRTAEI
jgi:hypothetical protein